VINAYEKCVEALLTQVGICEHGEIQPKDVIDDMFLNQCARRLIFHNDDEAQAMREVAKEIYERGKPGP
jgi:hypothetical protein